MKRLKKAAFFAVTILSASASVRAQDVSIRNGEYWIDQQFEQRKSVSITNGWQTELDVSSLSEGVHTFSFRASDSKGRWCAPLTKYFLRTMPTREGNAPTLYEYWIDGDFSNRVQNKMATDGTVNLELGLASFLAGMHTFNIRVGDGYGQWSAPQTKFFLVAAPTYSDNVVTTYKYWIDDNYEKAVTGIAAENGVIDMELDMSGLRKGIHTLAYQICDGRDALSSPVVKYFVIPELMPENNMIAAYEYWFNAGPRVRMEVEPSNPLMINDIWIEIKDVVPNDIPADYRFDVSKETVYCEDDVFFGMSAYDLAGNSSMAVLSDTFRMTLPVNPNFIDLTSEESIAFNAPGAGYIQGFRMSSAVGDSLVWTLNEACTADFYDSNGMRIKAEEKTDEAGAYIYYMKATTNVTYALLHHSPAVAKTMDISCYAVSANSISPQEWGCVFRSAKNRLTVDTAQSGRLCIVNVAGIAVVDEIISVGTSHFDIPSGIYLLQWNDTATRKVLVP